MGMEALRRRGRRDEKHCRQGRHRQVSPLHDLLLYEHFMSLISISYADGRERILPRSFGRGQRNHQRRPVRIGLLPLGGI